MANYELWYTDPAGNRLALLDEVIRLSFVLVFGDIGAAQLDLPGDRNPGGVHAGFSLDRQIHVYRAAHGQAKTLEGIFFTREWDHDADRRGMTTLRLGGHDLNYLLTSRIIAYYAGSSQSSKSGLADDMMKEIMRENFGASATDIARDLTAAGLTIDSDMGAGPSVSKAFARQQVLSVMQALQQQSRAAGNEVFWGVQTTSPNAYRFFTWTGQPGQDRTTNGSAPMIFSQGMGNLVNPRWIDNHTFEENYIYAGGQGEGENRNIQTATDTQGAERSPWNRREGFASAVQASSDAAVLAAARSRLEQRRPQHIFTAEILDTPHTPYGGSTGWRVGDRITAQDGGRTVDAIVRSAMFRIDGNGMERIGARIESADNDAELFV